MTVPDSVQRRRDQKLLDTWNKRREAAERDRKRYEPAWLTAQQFAAGRQWAAYVPREHRMLVPPLPAGRSRHTADRLTQYVMTVVGKLSSNDFRGQFVQARQDQATIDAELTLEQLLTYGWEREWMGDRQCMKLCRIIAWLGSGAIRSRFDPAQGPEMAAVPHRDGQPILDPAEARKFVADAQYYGEDAGLKKIREGRICWDVLSPWNLLPPPGVEEPADFPWELIVRPHTVKTIKDRFGVDVKPEEIQSMDLLGLDSKGGVTDDTMQASSPGALLQDHALVYTGYQQPDSDNPAGLTVVFTKDRILEQDQSLPLPATSCKPARSGINYFWYWRIPNRFWGRGLAEPGFGPQRLINKRLTQMDEIIDRGLPKTYAERGAITNIPEGRVLEIIEVKPGAAKPVLDEGLGPAKWFSDDIQMQDQNIEKALGVRSVSLGENPSGVQTYGQLALLREADADKIDPIAAELRLGINEVTYDSMELMRKWPPTKKLQIVGPDGNLGLFTLNQVNLPADYLILPTKGATQLRTTAAEIQKVESIWQAAMATGRTDLFDWYVQSLTSGKAQDMPPNPRREQQHVAALENVLLAHGELLPVEPDQDHALHIAAHREEQDEWRLQAIQGDPQAQQVASVFEQHILRHMQLLQPVLQPPPGASPQFAPPQPAGPAETPVRPPAPPTGPQPNG